MFWKLRVDLRFALVASGRLLPPTSHATPGAGATTANPSPAPAFSTVLHLMRRKTRLISELSNYAVRIFCHIRYYNCTKTSRLTPCIHSYACYYHQFFNAALSNCKHLAISGMAFDQIQITNTNHRTVATQNLSQTVSISKYNIQSSPLHTTKLPGFQSLPILITLTDPLHTQTAP